MISRPSKPHTWHLRAGHSHVSEPVCLRWDILGEGPNAHPPYAHSLCSVGKGKDGMRKLMVESECSEFAKPTRNEKKLFRLLLVKLDWASEKQSIKTGFLTSSTRGNFGWCFLYHMHSTSELFGVLQEGIRCWYKGIMVFILLQYIFALNLIWIMKRTV